MLCIGECNIPILISENNVYVYIYIPKALIIEYRINSVTTIVNWHRAKLAVESSHGMSCIMDITILNHKFSCCFSNVMKVIYKNIKERKKKFCPSVKSIRCYEKCNTYGTLCVHVALQRLFTENIRRKKK